MNQLETMRFVDKATPQQLTAMVNARDPFSYMALSKLQQIRDERMKAQAGQPAPPPMAEVIPQQVMQGAPQMPPQSMAQPPQMGIASLGGIGPNQEAAGAGGGMVAFTQGGGIKGYAEPPYLVKGDEGETNLGMAFDATRNAIGEKLDAIRNNPVSAAIANNLSTAAESMPLQEKNRAIRERIAQLTIGPLERLTPQQRGARNIEVQRLTDLLYSPTVSSNVPPASVPPVSAAKIGTNRVDLEEEGRGQTPAYKTAITPPAAPNQAASSLVGIPSVMPGLAAATRDLTKANQELTASRGEERKAMVAGMRDPEIDANTRATVMGSESDRDQNIAARQKALNESLPDQNARISTELEKMRVATAKSEENAPYQGLLKMAVSLMGTKSHNFLQAVGEAGGAGLEEFNKMQSANKAQKMALLSADANLASAQDARQRGLYAQAAQRTDKATQDRLDAFNFKRDSEMFNANIAIKLAGHKTGDSVQKIEATKNLFALQLANNTYQLQRQELMLRGLTHEAAMMPDSAKVINWLEKNPTKRPAFEKQENATRFLTVAAKGLVDLDQRQKNALANGIRPGEVGYPTEDTIMNEAAKIVARARDPEAASTPAATGQVVTKDGKSEWVPNSKKPN